MESITINPHLCLDLIQDTDARDLVEQINNKAVSDNLLHVPYPYNLSDAMSFIRHAQNQRENHGVNINWTIRYHNRVIGGIGQHLKYSKEQHRDEIGYWIGQGFWRRGIMTQVLKAYTNYLFNHSELIRLESPVFAQNIGSQRVLEKNNFSKEGHLKSAYYKDGVFLDAYLYALLKT